MVLSFSEKVKLESSDLVMTYRAESQDGRNFFAYILCNKEQVIAMKQDFATKKSVAPSNYGEVIYVDFLKDPDDRAKAFLESWLKDRAAN